MASRTQGTRTIPERPSIRAFHSFNAANEAYLWTLNGYERMRIERDLATGTVVYDLPWARLRLHLNERVLGLPPWVFEDLLEPYLPAPPSPVPQRVVPTTQGTIIRYRKTLASAYDRCPICMEVYKSNEKIWRLHPKCAFHKRCLDKFWKQNINTKCPLCAVDVGVVQEPCV